MIIQTRMTCWDTSNLLLLLQVHEVLGVLKIHNKHFSHTGPSSVITNFHFYIKSSQHKNVFNQLYSRSVTQWPKQKQYFRHMWKLTLTWHLKRKAPVIQFNLSIKIQKYTDIEIFCFLFIHKINRNHWNFDSSLTDLLKTCPFDLH